jgi:integrase
MTPLRKALEDYLRIRRQLGYQLKLDGQLLEDFVGFLEQAGATRITTELALDWAKLPAGARPHRWRQRLGIVRAFARYLATIDPSSEVPSSDLLPARAVRVAPHVYSDAETVALIGAARALSPVLRAATFETLIGLLAAAGLRLGEALSLDRQDVDLKSGALHVHAKRGKQREVPCMPPRPRRSASTPACAIATGRSRTRRRSSSQHAASGSPPPRSTTHSRG